MIGILLQYLVFVSAGAFLVAAYVYIRSMLKGSVKPNRASWLLWAIASMIGFAAAVSNGAGLAAVPMFMSGFCPLLIFAASFVVKGGSLEVGQTRLCLRPAVSLGLSFLGGDERSRRCHLVRNFKRHPGLSSDARKRVAASGIRVSMDVFGWNFRRPYEFPRNHRMDLFAVRLPSILSDNERSSSFEYLPEKNSYLFLKKRTLHF